MAKICISCGAQMQDDMGFCPSCGTPQPQGGQPQQPGFGQPQQGFGGQPQMNYGQPQQFGQPQQYGQPQMNYGQPGFGGAVPAKKFKMPDKKVLFVCGGVLVLVIVLIILLSIIFGSSYKDPLDNYVKVLEKGNGKAYQACVYEVDSVLADKKSATEYAEDAKDLHEEFEEDYGKGAKCTYEILSKEKLKKSDIETVNQWMSLLGVKDAIKDGYELKVAFTYSGSEDKNVDTQTVTVIKTSDGWKLTMGDTPDSIY